MAVWQYIINDFCPFNHRYDTLVVNYLIKLARHNTWIVKTIKVIVRQ